MDNYSDSDSHDIILHPEFEELKAEIDKLRTEISMLVLEQDELLYHECKNIEAKYMLSVGALEYKAYELECAILRLRRKIELIQEKKNRQEKIVLSKIDEILEFEFEEYQAKLNERINRMNAAIKRDGSRRLTEEENRELKKMYRAIVKALHPDLHPDLSAAKIELFYSALRAYKNGDIKGLEIIETMVSEPAVAIEITDGLAFLMGEKERLTKLLQVVKHRTAEIKLEYPYTMKSFVQSPEKIKARKTELEDHIKHLNEALAAYMARIEEMLRCVNE